MAKERKQLLEDVYALSDLPHQPDLHKIDQLLFELREAFYSNKNSMI